MNRRSFLASIFAAGMAPSFVRAESLMQLVRRPSGLLVPEFRWDEIEPFGQLSCRFDGAFLLRGERLLAVHKFEPDQIVTAGDILSVTFDYPAP